MSTEEKYTKVEPKEHIAAYLEDRALIRDTTLLLECDMNLIQQVTSNYIIVKKILSNLQWQDQIICKSVCKIWCDAVRTLQREFLRPQDFVLDLDAESVTLKKSENFTTEPMVVITFTDLPGYAKLYDCKSITPSPCSPSCGESHWIIDWIDQELSYPKKCLLMVRSNFIAYLPLPTSVTAAHTIQTLNPSSGPNFCGVCLPKLPGVQCDVLNIKGNCDMQKDFYDIVNKMAETRLFKGFLVFVTDKYLLNSLEDIEFLNYFKEIQPNDPYALGGCITDDTLYERSNYSVFMENYVNISENVVSIVMFSTSKQADKDDKTSFQMYSTVIESSEWTKPSIQKAINEFSGKVPRNEYSVVFKLACVGRDKKHVYEQDIFRAAFPNTPLIGCYGNGELGVNHPTREENTTGITKRKKLDAPQFGIMYSYSTVFVYIGWGRTVTKSC